jgi:hypothetical protein
MLLNRGCSELGAKAAMGNIKRRELMKQRQSAESRPVVEGADLLGMNEARAQEALSLGQHRCAQPSLLVAELTRRYGFARSGEHIG